MILTTPSVRDTLLLRRDRSMANDNHQMFLIKQDVIGLKGEYITEALVFALNEERAFRAVERLAESWDVIAVPQRFRAFTLGLAPVRLGVAPRFKDNNGHVFIVGMGHDD